MTQSPAQEENLFKSLFLAMQDGMAIHHILRDDAGKMYDTEIVAINETWRQAMHLEGPYIPGKRLSQIFVLWPVSGRMMMDLFAQIAETGETISEEVAYPRDNKYYRVTLVKIAEDTIAATFHETTDYVLPNLIQQSIFNSVSDVVIVLDLESGVLIDINARGEEMVGHPREKLLGLITLPEEPIEFMRARDDILQRARAGETEFEMLIPVTTRRGHRWYDLRVRVAEATGKKRIVILLQDVTETQRQMQALVESEERYRAVSEILSDFAYAITMDNETGRRRLDWITDAFTTLTGCSEVEARQLFDENPRKFMARFIHPDDHSQVYAAWYKTLEQGSAVCEYRQLCPGGSAIWVQATMKKTPLPGGMETRVYAAVKDVSARVQAENAYLSIFNAVNDNIFVHDIETGKIVDMNIRAAMMMGYPRDEIIDRLRMPHETREMARHRASLIQRAALGEVFADESIYTDPDGQKYWIESRYRVADIAGKKRVVCVARDITERKKTIQALELSEKRSQAISSLITNTAFQVSCNDEGTWSLDWLLGPVTRFTGYSNEDIREFLSQQDNQTILQRFIHPDDIWKVMHELLASKPADPVICDFRLMRRNRTAVWARGYFRPTLKNKKLVRLAGALQDITGQLLAERNYRALFESAINALIILDPQDGSVLDANHLGDSMLIEFWSGNPETLRPEAIFQDISQDEFLNLLHAAAAGEIVERRWQTRSNGGQPSRDYAVNFRPVDLGEERRVLASFRQVDTISRS